MLQHNIIDFGRQRELVWLCSEWDRGRPPLKTGEEQEPGDGAQATDKSSLCQALLIAALRPTTMLRVNRNRRLVIIRSVVYWWPHTPPAAAEATE